ncbi:hypothetical protein QBC41DRAFT_351210 [Cercophora samala]|uniref:Nephrocystin 3-like N-terminal domain-containing protein n=1 Tax=Cercophora samala TaxID=330535 RepID=A0AA40D167_9PEZI|nr:hypothetical protein QBC41DRAFT_351210 [Cercophora samala]
MAQSSTPFPSLLSQPPSVDFIDNRAYQYHAAFGDSGTRYDATVQQYVAASSRSTAVQGVLAQNDPSNETEGINPTAIEAMKFWSAVFGDAMKDFHRNAEDELPVLVTLECSIRAQRDWKGVYAQLQKAREIYDGTKQGFRGKCKRGWRQVVEHSDLARRVVKLVPDVEYISPVLTVLEVMLEAAQVASEVREQVTTSFDGERLERMFGDIDVFLATFPEDEKIREASIALVVATFVAIEETILFFLSHQIRRGASAVFRGNKYQGSLIEKLNQVQEQSNWLIHQAQNSHISRVREDMQRTLARTWRIEVGIEEVRRDLKHGVQAIQDKVDSNTKVVVEVIEGTGVSLRNTLKEMLDDADTKRRREREQDFAWFQEQLKSQQDQFLRAGHAMLRQLTPSPTYHPLPWSPPLQIEPSYPSRPSTPQPQLAWLPQQQHLSPPFSQSSPMYAPQPQPYHHPLPPHPQSNTLTLLNHLITSLPLPNPDFDLTDLSQVLDSQPLIPLRQRTRAEQAFNSDQFRSWLTSSTSSRLLIHGDFDRAHPPLISGLSFAAATLVETLRERQGQYITLVFFCGLHAEQDDDYSGAVRMLGGFIVQLLRQWPGLVVTEEEVRVVAGGQDMGVEVLGWLLGALVKRVARGVDVFFVVDGVVHYENRYFEEGLLGVLRVVASLVGQDGGPTVKVLVTSPVKTEEVWRLFSDDDDGAVEMLEMEGLPVVSDSYGHGLEFQVRG